jgi:hypothetical protein
MDFQSLDFEGEVIKLDISHDRNLTAVDIGGTKLVFFFENNRDYYFVAGYPLQAFLTNGENSYTQELFAKLEEFFDNNYRDTDWSTLVGNDFSEFEHELLTKTVYPWMKENKSPHSCIMGKNCPMRVAMTGEYSEKQTIWDALNTTFTTYRKLSIFRKMRLMFAGIRHKLSAPA